MHTILVGPNFVLIVSLLCIQLIFHQRHHLQRKKICIAQKNGVIKIKIYETYVILRCVSSISNNIIKNYSDIVKRKEKTYQVQNDRIFPQHWLIAPLFF